MRIFFNVYCSLQLGCEIEEDEKLKDMILINKVCKPKVQQSVATATQQRSSITRSHIWRLSFLFAGVPRI